ncbi:hypothetical protein [Nocardia nova]|uniref:hypothetical protein n=1 Tax=Nocardia nova TaxID=37330 RepID=UPI0011DC7C84|nr:hypothetical protein [Nocardia nova]
MRKASYRTVTPAKRQIWHHLRRTQPSEFDHTAAEEKSDIAELSCRPSKEPGTGNNRKVCATSHIFPKYTVKQHYCRKVAAIYRSPSTAGQPAEPPEQQEMLSPINSNSN